MVKDLLRNAPSEWQLLLACCSPTCGAARARQLRATPLSRVDWARLLELGEDHGATPLLARCLDAAFGDQLPSASREHLQERRRSHLLVVLSLTAELFRIVEMFEREGVEFAVFKGPALAVQAFGDAALREYADLDLFLGHRDVLRACKLLLASGFQARLPLDRAEAGQVPGQFLFTRTGSAAIVELHTERTLRYIPRPLPVEALLARRTKVALDGREVPAFSREDSLVLIAIHGSKHFWERLMWIADVAALASSEPGPDAATTLRLARELGATRMLRLGLCLAHDLLQASLPEDFAREAMSDRAARSMAGSVARRLLAGAQPERNVFERAWFRARMRGSLLGSLPYVLRLTLAPTEDDWGAAKESGRSRIFSLVRRPLRLLRKYGVERH
jgi:hypothetical protein